MLYLFIWENNNGGGQECNKLGYEYDYNQEQQKSSKKKYILCEYEYIWNMFAFSQCSSMKSRRQTYFEKWKGEEEMQN